MLILKGLAVDEEAVSVVEMEGTAVQISGRLRGGWAGPRSVVGLSGWHSRWSRLGSEDEMRCFATLSMTTGGRGRGVGGACLCAG